MYGSHNLFCIFFRVGFQIVQNHEIADSYTLSGVFPVPRGSKRDPKGRPTNRPFGSLFRPGVQWGPRGAQEVPKGAQKGSRGSQKESKGCQGGAKKGPGGPKRGPGEATGTPKGVQGESKRCSRHGGGEAEGKWIYIGR